MKGAAIRSLRAFRAVRARNKHLCCKKDTNFTCSVYLSTRMHTEVCLFSVEPLRKDGFVKSLNYLSFRAKREIPEI
jgi:hypothetical protein